MPSVKPKVSRIQKRLGIHPELRVPLGKLHTQSEMENTFWTDLEGQYDVSREAVTKQFTGVIANIESVRAIPQAVALIEDGRTLAKNIRLLTKDCRSHIERLDSIHAKHCDKTGTTRSPDEHMTAFACQNDYLDAQTIFDATNKPTVDHILEQLSVADPILDIMNEEIQRLRQEQASAASLAQAQNPNEVTDVVAK